jgi:hypothetical protein
VLTLLLRLRQVCFKFSYGVKTCCHPLLVVQFNEQLAKEQKDADEKAKAEKEKAVGALLEKIDPGVVKRLTEMDGGLQSEDCPICFDSVLPGVIILPCGHPFCEECYYQLIKDQNLECPNWLVNDISNFNVVEVKLMISQW